MTIQISDSLIYKGESLNINSGYISPFGGLSNSDEVELAFTSSSSKSSFCWRGYVATWEIIDSKLYLVEVSNQIIVKEGDEPIGNQLGELYNTDQSSVKAIWVSGTIETFSGLCVGRCGGTIRVYEKYHAFEVSKGKIISVNEYDAEWWKAKNRCIEREIAFNNLLKETENTNGKGD